MSGWLTSYFQSSARRISEFVRSGAIASSMPIL
jgi:hypothetical protein